MPKFSIVVCSKGRATASTMRLLSNAALPFTVVVEPQDFEAYAAQFKTNKTVEIVTLPENDGGLALARQFCLLKARRENLDWYWLLDDDIKNFYRIVDARAIKMPVAGALEVAEALFTAEARVNPFLAQVGLEYAQFGWSSRRPFVLNSYCDVAVCINAAAPVNYRTELPFKADREYTLQLLALGFQVMKINHVCFEAPKNGSNAGGLFELYKTDAQERAARRVCELHPLVCKFQVKKDGRPDVKINWRAFEVKAAAV